MAETPPFDAAAWSRYLTAELGKPVEVRFGRARRQVIVARPEGDGFVVRLHRVFGEAPEEVRHAVARWLAVGRRARKASAVLDAWIEEITPRLQPARRDPLRPRGRAHDLEVLRDELVAGELHDLAAGAAIPPVTWGRRGKRRPRRTLQLGSFDPEAGLIRVHPVLDQAAVPRFFVRYVLYHELLHALGPDERGPGGRRLHHGPRFREREKAYADYGRALAWQEAHLARLLRSASTGAELAPSKAPIDLPGQRWFPGF